MPHREVEAPDFIQMVRRIVRAAGRRMANGDTDQLRDLIAIRGDLDDAILAAVRGLRASGHTWEDIGAATGTTRQAALMKWGPRL